MRSMTLANVVNIVSICQIQALLHVTMPASFTQLTCGRIPLSHITITAGSIVPPRCDPSRLPEGAREAAGPDSSL